MAIYSAGSVFFAGSSGLIHGCPRTIMYPNRISNPAFPILPEFFTGGPHSEMFLVLADVPVITPNGHLPTRGENVEEEDVGNFITIPGTEGPMQSTLLAYF
jgi:hypothetical protein